MTRKWRIEEGWATLLLLTAMLLSVVWAVRAAEWTDGLGILQWVALMALLVSLVVTQLRRFPALLAWPLLLVAGIASAQGGAPAGDAAKGREKVQMCQGCHGITGYKNAYPSFKVPLIGGQSAEYLAQALHEYRDGTRKHPTMQAQAQSFSDQDIADIAAFLSTLK